MARRVIVFVHGYMGSSKQFDPLIEILNGQDAAAIHKVVLPGHGASIKEFSAGRADEWQYAVDGVLDELRLKYDEIILVGHSMGGLLLINSSVKCADSIHAIFAIALPLHIKITFNGIIIRIGSVMHSSSDKYTESAKELRGVSGVTLVNAYGLIPTALEFLTIAERTKRILPKLSVP